MPLQSFLQIVSLKIRKNTTTHRTRLTPSFPFENSVRSMVVRQQIPDKAKEAKQVSLIPITRTKNKKVRQPIISTDAFKMLFT